MPNKDISEVIMENKVPVSTPQSKTNTKCTVVTAKPTAHKPVVPKDPTMSPGALGDEERTELLGSLTTQQQQRTSARVIKKLRLESPADKRDTTECETPNKIDDKDPLKFPTVKQRMPKALWSADEKSLFFEALNEYGKDFDAITAYICGKMKKKGMTDGLKTKTQVSHFYYRTWHKLSKHVQFDENVKKVAQELYALINYGELRRKLASVSEKTCARLGEMVRGGSMAVRVRGRTLRVRTPMCRALRRLNQITERACGTRVCSRAQVVLRARNSCAWARVQAAAHNPRVAAALPLRTRLAAFLRALQRRWKTSNCKEPVVANGVDKEDHIHPEELEVREDRDDELESHLNLETDRVIARERKLPKKLALHLGPRPGADIHLPVLSPSEQLSSQKICFSSYLERMGSLHRDKDSGKIRTPKRQRKDSTSEKDKDDPKKIKLDDVDNKLINIDETAIDGIELMAHYKNIHDDEEKPSTEDEKDLKSEETAEEDGEPLERDNVMSEREKDSFSEMEDEEKYNKSDTDNESDGKIDKDNKFKQLKVKFRIRPKKRGGSSYTLVLDKDCDDAKKDDAEELKVEEPKCEEEIKPVIDVETAIRQIRAGWSQYDAGDLTIGDLYLMFGSRSKLELDYWWAEVTPPLPQPIKVHKTSEGERMEKDRLLDRREKGNKTPEKGDSSVDDERDKSDTDILFSPKNTFSQDSNDGMSGDERKSEALASPDHKSSGTLKLVSKLINRADPQPPTDGFFMLSDRLKRLLALAGNTHITAAANTPSAKCNCGHVCPKKQLQKPQTYPAQAPANFVARSSDSSVVFRHPTPIAPRPYSESRSAVSLDGLPRRKRGRPRVSDRTSPRVVVQRLLPLLPKLPTPSNLIPVKLVPNSSPPAPTRILPKPPPPLPTTTADLSAYYVLSESNGQFFFHDGDRRIPISAPDEDDDPDDVKEEVKQETTGLNGDTLKLKQESNSEPDKKLDPADMTSFLTSESMSLSPSRLLRDAEGWLEGSVQDFSLSSFLNQLEGRHPDTTVESQLQSLMAESSVDYVAKFADLAAEVTDQRDHDEDIS